LISTHLRIAMYAISRPAAWFYLIRIEAPELQFLFKQWSTDVRWVMQFASSENKNVVKNYI